MWILSILNEEQIKWGPFGPNVEKCSGKLRDYEDSLWSQQEEVIVCIIQGVSSYNPFQTPVCASTMYRSSHCPCELLRFPDMCNLCFCISGWMFASPAVHCSKTFLIVAFAMLPSFISVWCIYLLVYSDHRVVSMTTFTFKNCHEHERHPQTRALWACSGSGRDALAIKTPSQVLVRCIRYLWLKLVIFF